MTNNKQHSILSCDSDCFTCFSVNGKLFSFLVDSGASLSAIKYSYVIGLNLTLHKEDITINGLGGKVRALGYVYLQLSSDDVTISHKFYVLNTLPITSNGIIGRDFLRRFRSVLNFDTNILTLRDTINRTITLPITTKSNNLLEVSARSESIHYIQTQFEEECVICSTELQDGVYLASSIASPVKGVLPIKILNTTENNVTLSTFNFDIHKLSDYNICSFDKIENKADRVKQLFSYVNFSHMNDEEQISIGNLCAKYADIFYLPGDKLSTTDIYTHTITLKPGTTPFFSKQYRLPHAQKHEVKQQIDEMVKEGIVEPSKSEWSSPVLLVPKKSDTTGAKKWRLVIDYRKLNNCIVDDKYPLPDITEILESLSGSIYFSHLDLHRGYYNVKLDENSRKFTAFASGQFQMTRMPMGLKTSPSSFSRMMNVALAGLTYEKCLIYLDDLICFGRNLDIHNKNLQDVFERLRKVNLKLNPSKCDFLKKEILYLGHVISNKGIQPDPEKINTVKNYPRPKSCDEVKRFVAFVNYYRKFIQNFAEIAYPLNALCRKNACFIWDQKCQQAFETLREKIISPPILQYPDFSEENNFIIQTDASNYAIGAILANKDGRPVAFASRSLNKAEKNYPVIEKELLAIVWAVKYFRPYVYGQYFKIRTDHRPLVYLFNMKDPSTRLMKFRLALEEYNFDVEYVKGCNNNAADALSRISLNELKEMHDNVVNVLTRAQARKLRDSSVDIVPSDDWPDQPKVVGIHIKPKESVELVFTDVKKYTKMKNEGIISHDSEVLCYANSKRTIYIKFLDSQSRITRGEFVKELDKMCKEINVEDVCIVKRNGNEVFINSLLEEINKMKDRSGPRLCIIKDVATVNEKDDRRVILNDFHLLPSSGHAGMRRMSNNIKKYYYWPGIDKDVRDFVKRCDVCQRQKHSTPIKEPMNITTTANSAFEKIFLDLVGPLETDNENFSYILTLQCELSKYVEAYPLVSKKTDEVARSLVNNFILRYGVPKEIATDRGKEFISSTFQEMCKLLQIKQLHSTAYHHQSIGALEVSHKHLNSFLRIHTDKHPETWSKWLPFWCFAYNTSVNSETHFTPYELVFGKKCILPSNLNKDIVEPIYNYESYPCELKYRIQLSQKEARDNLLFSKLKRKTTYDKYTNPITYNANDLVLIKNEGGNKFDDVYSAPYKVIRDITPNVEILKNNKLDIVHKNRTKLYHS